MKITAVTADQIILVNLVPADIRTIGGYHMQNGEWAIHYDTELGYGEIEYLDNRPNRRIEKPEFDQHYSWLLTEHQRYLDHVAEQERLQAEAEAAANEPDANSEPSADSGSI